jgi:hypothetical protein
MTRQKNGRDLGNQIGEKGNAHRNKFRLIGLLILFDALLIATVVLSFQTSELVEEETTLRQTREVYDVEIREQVITSTQIITEIVPYGYSE